MLLSINQKKVDDQLAKSVPTYVVSPCNWESQQDPITDMPTANISGTVSGMPPELELFRDRVFSLRQRIIDRGEHPASSPEELEHLIDDLRGRA
jgi:hypothetical protein